MKSWMANTLLVLVSIGISFVIAEFLLRYMLFSGGDAFASLREASAYVRIIDDRHEDFRDENYWKLLCRFSEKNQVESAHPLLGWMHGIDPESLKHRNAGRLAGRRPVLLYGDSFAQCVDSTWCFDEILNGDPAFNSDHYFLNYGIGGYGVDQIALLYEHSRHHYQDPFVIFSMLTTDLDRSMLSFRDSQKPYFQVENEELVLKGVPLSGSTLEYVEEHPPRIRSYLWNRFINSRLYPFAPSSKRRIKRHISAVKELNRLILERVFDQLKSSGSDYVILIFSPESHDLPDWRLEFLTKLCDEHQMPYVCDRDLRLGDNTFSEYDPHRYAIQGDGHPTSYMNDIIAGEMKRMVLLEGYEDTLRQKQQDQWKLRVGEYRTMILRDSAWMAQIREKARERSVSVDSMLTIDALYLLQKHND